MQEHQRQDILLESGTNEMEIIEFYLGSQPFGINVQKLKEIIPFSADRMTAIPGSAPGMLGTFLLRGSTIPLIDLKTHLASRQDGSEVGADRQVVLVCEFNNRINGFKVDGVNQIHRISWENVHPMAPFIDQYRPRFTGSINIDHREILIVDLEHIITEFDPESALDYDNGSEQQPVQDELQQLRARVKLMMAEDSSLIRAGIEKVLTGSGFTDLEVFVDGQECFERIQQIKKQVEGGEELSSLLNLLITDIEMPRMDGLTLCRRIKEDPVFKGVKVILFSSLINEQMAAKCDSVGADGYATKPQIPYLVAMMDRVLELAEDS